MTTLSIAHSIFLSPEDLINLTNKQAITTIGISVPVWFRKGTTSEPAEEVICKYLISNDPEDSQVATFEEGYKINLPQTRRQVKTNSEDILKTISSGEVISFKRYDHTAADKVAIVHFIDISSTDLLKKTID